MERTADIVTSRCPSILLLVIDLANISRWYGHRVPYAYCRWRLRRRDFPCQVLAAGNLGGRIGWAAFSDKFGRKLTFNMFCLGSIPLYLAVPYTVQQVVETGVRLDSRGVPLLSTQRLPASINHFLNRFGGLLPVSRLTYRRLSRVVYPLPRAYVGTIIFLGLGRPSTAHSFTPVFLP